MHHHHGSAKGKTLARQLAKMRVATAPLVDDLAAAKAAGYKQITPMMHNMGFHYLNPDITTFDPAKPPILVYTRRDGKYQLGALEWVFPKKPKKAPLKGATMARSRPPATTTTGPSLLRPRRVTARRPTTPARRSSSSTPSS